MTRHVLLLALAACSASVDNPTQPGGVDASLPGGGGGSEYVRYRGTLPMTPAQAFGGGTFCSYSVVLRTVEIDLVLRKTDELAAMAIEDTMTESIVGMCPYTPEPPSRQLFSHDSGRPVRANSEGKVEPMLTGATANRPMTAATAVVAAQAGLVTATVRWERIDQQPPLKWIIETAAPLTLQPQTCTAGANVCVGGSGGMLYVCDDGMKMTPVRICANGCAASKTACN